MFAEVVPRKNKTSPVGETCLPQNCQLRWRVSALYLRDSTNCYQRSPVGHKLRQASRVQQCQIWIIYQVCIYIYFDYIYYMDLVYPNSKTTNDSLADRIIQMFALVDNTWNSMQKDLSWYYMFILFLVIYICTCWYRYVSSQSSGGVAM